MFREGKGDKSKIDSMVMSYVFRYSPPSLCYEKINNVLDNIIKHALLLS